MAITRHTVSVCLLALGLIASTAAGQIRFKVTPQPVVEGGSLTVEVTAAPEFPVDIEIYIDGQLHHEETITSVNDTVTTPIPPGTAGSEWEVVVTSGTDQELDSGTIAAGGEDEALPWLRALHALQNP